MRLGCAYWDLLVSCSIGHLAAVPESTSKKVEFHLLLNSKLLQFDYCQPPMNVDLVTYLGGLCCHVVINTTCCIQLLLQRLSKCGHVDSQALSFNQPSVPLCLVILVELYCWPVHTLYNFARGHAGGFGVPGY